MTSLTKNLPDLKIDIDQPKDEVVSACKDLVSQVKPEWSPLDLKEKIFSDGITNVLVGIYCGDAKDNMVLVRMYGHHTDQIIDRDSEITNMKLFKDHQCGPDLLAIFQNGIAYSFIPGIIPTSDMIVDTQFNQLVIEMMVKMHKMRLGGTPCMWERLKSFHKASPDGFPHDAKKQKRLEECKIMSKEQLLGEIELLEKNLKGSKSPVVFCHNDLLLGNIVYDKKENKVTFIDYEYGAQNYLALDIGNHFTEFVGVSDQMDYEHWYPKEKAQKDWIKRYLIAFHDGKTPSEQEIHETYVEVNKFSLCANLKWGIWALVQAKNSNLDFDFIDYAMQRLNEYLRNRDRFLSLK